MNILKTEKPSAKALTVSILNPAIENIDMAVVAKDKKIQIKDIILAT